MDPNSDPDPDPGSGSWIRILLFSPLTFKMAAKNKFFNTITLLLFEGIFTLFFKAKKSKRITKQ
jgi:hypothetical protein